MTSRPLHRTSSHSIGSHPQGLAFFQALSEVIMSNPSQQPDPDDTPEYPLSAPIDPRDPERREADEERGESQTPEEGVRISESEAEPDEPDIAGNDLPRTPV